MRNFIAIGLLALLLVACSTAPASTDTGATQATEDSVLTDIKGLFASGAAVKCTVKHEGVTATMYMSGKNQRIESASAEGSANIISDGTMMYMWSGAEGVKINLEKAQEMGDNAPTGDIDTPEDWVNNAGDVKCYPWVVSGSMFVPPSNVKFTDLTAMMEQMQQQQSQYDGY